MNSNYNLTEICDGLGYKKIPLKTLEKLPSFKVEIDEGVKNYYLNHIDLCYFLARSRKENARKMYESFFNKIEEKSCTELDKKLEKKDVPTVTRKVRSKNGEIQEKEFTIFEMRDIIAQKLKIENGLLDEADSEIPDFVEDNDTIPPIIEKYLDSEETLYDILELFENATDRDIRGSYELLTEEGGLHFSVFCKLKDAHDILIDGHTRKIYDSELAKRRQKTKIPNISKDSMYMDV